MANNNVAYIVSPGQLYQGAHVYPAPGSVIFAKRVVAAGGLTAGGNIPTVAALAGSGTGASVSQVNGYDMAGNFTLTTAGTGSVAGGSLASVTFGQPLDVAPVAVYVSAGPPSGATGLPVAAVTLSKTGFTIQGTGPGTASSPYLFNWLVVKSPTGQV